MRTRDKDPHDTMRSEYDIAALMKGGVRGKHAEAYHAGTNLILLEPEIRKHFRTEKDVNDALRLVLELRKIGTRRKR